MPTTAPDVLPPIRVAVEGLDVEQDPVQAEALARELQTLVDDLRARIRVVRGKEAVNMKDAAELMGEGFYFGPEAAEKAWGVKLTPEQIPLILFSHAELERAKEMGQMLILRVKTAPDGKPFSMRKQNELLKQGFAEEGKGKVLFEDEGWQATEEFFNVYTPELEWALATKGVLPDSTDKDDLDHTQMLADYVKAVFADQEMPAEFVEALAEFKREKDSIAELFNDLDRNWQEAVRRTSELKLNQLVRRDPVEELHDTLSVFQNTGERINEGVYARTKRRLSDGCLVYVGGGFGRGGGAIVSYSVGSARSSIGVSFSRSKKL